MGLWRFGRMAQAEMAEAVGLMDPAHYALGPVADARTFVPAPAVAG
jgi:hypothetical protein